MRFFRFCRLFVMVLALVALSWSVVVNNLSAQGGMPRLAVSANGRYLITEDGRPFFWMGDTAWELFARLTREQAEQYLENRRANGFTVVQVVILTEFSMEQPNRYGHTPIRNNDPLQTNEEYFAYVDWFVNRAAEKGLYVALLPTWGDKVNKQWGRGPVIFNPNNAREYGAFLGRRYAWNTNVVWMLGGDRNVDDWNQRSIWRAMAQGIESGAGASALITYHPAGWRNSATWFNNDRLFDFNAVQSGHSYRDTPSWDWILESYRLSPAKPIIDAEISYEDHPVSFNTANGRFTDHDTRKAMYRAVFAGAAGVTYGHNSIWQFYQPGNAHEFAPTVLWNQALDSLGSRQVRHLRTLMESRPYLTRIPDVNGDDDDEDDDGEGILRNWRRGGSERRMIATRDREGTYAFIYTPVVQSIEVNMGVIKDNTVRAWWFSPRNGTATLIGEFSASGRRRFDPPNTGTDWVLVLDAASRNYPAPGQGANPPPAQQPTSVPPTNTPLPTNTPPPTFAPPTNTPLPANTPVVAPTFIPPGEDQGGNAGGDPQPAPPGNVAFYRGINLGGGAMTVDGNYWQGDNIQAWDFLSKGFAQCNQWLRPNPPTSSSVTGMLSCWRQSWAHNFNVPDVPWADYQVYIYVVKDWSPSRPYNVDLFLEGQQLTTITTGSAGEWQRVGPFPVRVTDGALTIRTRGGVLNIAGIEIWN